MTSTLETPLVGVHVLLVDDDESTRELFAAALTDAGADVRTASGAREAMRTLLQWRPSILVSDLSMPTMDGCELLREVLSVDRLRPIPAIAVTGHSRPRDRAAAREAGFQELVVKPLPPAELVAAVQRWAPGPPTK